VTKNLVVAKVLIVDDDQLFCDSLKLYFYQDPIVFSSAHSIEQAQQLCVENKYDVVLLDNNLPDGDGLSFLPNILRLNDNGKVILITAYPNLDNAVKAIKTGAYDYICKPIQLEELRVMVERAIRARQLEEVEQVQKYKDIHESEDSILIGNTSAFNEVKQMIKKASNSTAPVLITGETGTGKNILAKAIHFGQDRKIGAFISVNCAALPENLIEAELFGVEKGAFTGAIATRKGAFEIADKGTLFLDEIGEMPISLQSKLLTVLEDHKIKKIGGEITRKINVRIIAATNANPEEAIANGKLRRDIFYRLSVINIHLPSLRERKEDIADLCKFFIKKLAPSRVVNVQKSEIDMLMDYSWPGNIRELKNLIERSLILQEGEYIYPSSLILNDKKTSKNWIEYQSSNLKILKLEDMERQHILKVFELQGKNYSRTAEMLGISLSTLKRKLTLYGIRVPVQNEYLTK
jgi:DNA-binding NtrC family response regulator